MPSDEALQKRDEDYASDEDDDDELEQVPSIDVDVTKLNPLSPEVISKQVCNPKVFFSPRDLTGYLQPLFHRQQST